MVGVPLAVVGVDFRRASTRWRAAMALDPAARVDLHRALAQQGATGFAAVATCNRTEWIAAGPQPEWIAQLLRSEALERLAQHDADPPEPFVHTGATAAEHLLRVALGLESLAVGERHIARQLHEAFHTAREEATACGVLNVLETVLGRAVRKSVRLPRGRGAAGMHRLVADALRQHLGAERSGLPVLVVGMGAIGRKVAERVAADYPVVRVNRTARAGWLPLDAVREAPPPHRAVVLCSGAAAPIWGPAQLHPDARVVVDIGSPGQADPTLAAHLPLIDLDALVAMVGGADVPALAEAVDTGLDDLQRALGARTYRELVRVSRESYQHLSREALPRALRALELPPREKQRLEAELREMMRGYAERMLDATLQLAQEGP